MEITDINNAYLAAGTLQVKHLGRGFTWLDIGTPESLMDAGHYIHSLEKRQGLKVACLEEIAYRQGWLTEQELIQRGKDMETTDYGRYLLRLGSR